jgi:uncharacterized membrane protein
MAKLTDAEQAKYETMVRWVSSAIVGAGVGAGAGYMHSGKEGAAYGAVGGVLAVLGGNAAAGKAVEWSHKKWIAEA